jgi:hypothetical protein
LCGGGIPQNIHIEINKKGVVYVIIIMVATYASWTPSSFIHPWKMDEMMDEV